jgi:hypothetical protein
VDDDVEEYQSSRKRRTENYSVIEDTCLVREWSHVSIDAAIESDETGNLYWQCIEDMFLKIMPRDGTLVSRSFRSVQHRWDAITSSCSSWAEAMEQVRAQH